MIGMLSLLEKDTTGYKVYFGCCRQYGVELCLIQGGKNRDCGELYGNLPVILQHISNGSHDDLIKVKAI